MTHLHSDTDKRGPLDVNLLNRFNYLSAILNGGATAVFIPPNESTLLKHRPFDDVHVSLALHSAHPKLAIAFIFQEKRNSMPKERWNCKSFWSTNAKWCLLVSSAGHVVHVARGLVSGQAAAHHLQAAATGLRGRGLACAQQANRQWRQSARREGQSRLPLHLRAAYRYENHPSMWFPQ